MIKKRHTWQKDSIISFFEKNKGKHMTAENVVFELTKQDFKVSQATVYRNLAELVKEGVLRKYISENTKGACYQYVDNANKCIQHYHLICDECGKIIHFEGSEFEQLKYKVLSENKFELNLQKIVLYGKCEKCKENM